MRTLSSFEQLLATTDGGGIQLHQYASGTIAASGPGWQGAPPRPTDYPWDGRVEVRRRGHAGLRPGALSLRVPDWCRSATLSVAGVEQPSAVRDGRLSVERTLESR